MRPSRWMTNFTNAEPSVFCLKSQLRLTRSSIVVRYSGQQKLATSRYPELPPPPDDSPNPCPLAPVSATAVPVWTSFPRVGVRLDGSFAGFVSGGGVFLGGG